MFSPFMRADRQPSDRMQKFAEGPFGACELACSGSSMANVSANATDERTARVEPGPQKTHFSGTNEGEYKGRQMRRAEMGNDS